MSRWSRADVHATWSNGEVCLWAWADGPARTAPLNALYADVYAGRPSGRVGSLRVAVPGRGEVSVPCMHWPVRAAIESFSGRPCSPSWSASVAWFHRVARFAGVLAGTRHVVPTLQSADGTPQQASARWLLVRTDAVDRVIERLAFHMPPVVAAAGEVEVVELVERFADAAARTGLRLSRWRPPASGRRESAVRNVRTVFRHLSDDALAPRGGFDVPGALEQVQHAFGLERARLLGEPLLRARLRMAPPADAEGSWSFALEVVDATDPTRWCSAADALASSGRAGEVSTSRHGQASMRALVLSSSAAIVDRVPVLAPLALSPEEPAALDIDDASTVLALASRLDGLGVELLGPEQLVRASVRVTAQAVPVPESASSAGLNAKALVHWGARIDDTAVDPAELERAAAAGSALMRVGERWIRLEEAQVRRVLDALDLHRAQHAEVDAATLLRLTADDDLDVAAGSTGELDAHDGSDDGVIGAGDGAHSWVSELLAGLPDDRLVETREPVGFTGELRHYQRRALSWLAFHRRLGFGAVLADDMGLGKTATALAHLLREPGPHLVVCPLSVVRNWEREAQRFAPELRVHVHHGDSRAEGDAAVEQLGSVDLVVTTYGLVSREVDTLQRVRWGVVVLDEAQAVKNPNTKAARAVRRLGAAQRIALTGTPIENRLSELWSILDVVNPGFLGSLARFQARFGVRIERDRDETAAEQLRRLTSPFLLRRTKADKQLLPDLPDKIEQIAWATLTREQASMYQGVVDELLANAERAEGMRRRGLVLASLTRLKQICNHPAQALGDGSRLAGRSGKLARFDELVDELIDADQRALVFTQYREMGVLIQRHLVERIGLSAPFLHGGVARRQRDAMVDRFQSGDGPPLLLVSLKAGGTGLNLTAATRVIHYDRWWNPAVEDQATDRAWRIGQTQTVFAHKLVCSGTLEERIGQLIDDKRALASAVVGATGEAWLSELSTDELRDLVVLDRSAGGR